LYIMASCTKRQVVQNGKLYKMASCTKWQVVQNGELYKMASCLKWQVDKIECQPIDMLTKWQVGKTTS